jgi:hypothetical protein
MPNSLLISILQSNSKVLNLLRKQEKYITDNHIAEQMVHFKCLRHASGHEYNNSKELIMNKKGFTKIILK